MAGLDSYTILSIPLNYSNPLTLEQQLTVAEYVENYGYASFIPSNLEKIRRMVLPPSCSILCPSFCVVLIVILKELVKRERAIALAMKDEIEFKIAEKVSAEIAEAGEERRAKSYLRGVRKRSEEATAQRMLEESDKEYYHPPTSSFARTSLANILSCVRESEDLKSLEKLYNVLTELTSELLGKQDRSHLFVGSHPETALILLDYKGLYRGHIYVFSSTRGIQPNDLIAEAIGIRTSTENLLCKQFPKVAIRLFHGVLLWAQKYGAKFVEVYPLEVMKKVLREQLGFKQDIGVRHDRYYTSINNLTSVMSRVDPVDPEYVDYECTSSPLATFDDYLQGRRVLEALAEQQDGKEERKA